MTNDVAAQPLDTSFTGLVERLAGAQKSARGTPAYSRWVNRPVGRYFAALAYRLSMTPNQVTAVSATFTFAAIAAVAIVRPSIPVAIAVALALLIGYALDSADGQLARLRGGGTMAGEWLDHVTDSVKNFSLHLAVAISWFRFAGLDRARLLLIPLAYAVVAATLFFGMTLIDQMRRRSTRSKVVAKDDPNGPRLPAPVLPSLLVLPNDYGLLCLIFCTLAWTRGFELIYSALLVINVLYLAAAIRKWFREVKTL